MLPLPNRVFHSFQSRVFPIKKVDGDFIDSKGCFALDLLKVVAPQLEREWMSILHTFFPRGHNLEGKSNNGRSYLKGTLNFCNVVEKGR